MKKTEGGRKMEREKDLKKLKELEEKVDRILEKLIRVIEGQCGELPISREKLKELLISLFLASIKIKKGIPLLVIKDIPIPILLELGAWLKITQVEEAIKMLKDENFFNEKIKEIRKEIEEGTFEIDSLTKLLIFISLLITELKTDKVEELIEYSPQLEKILEKVLKEEKDKVELIYLTEGAIWTSKKIKTIEDKLKIKEMVLNSLISLGLTLTKDILEIALQEGLIDIFTFIEILSSYTQD